MSRRSRALLIAVAGVLIAVTTAVAPLRAAAYEHRPRQSSPNRSKAAHGQKQKPSEPAPPLTDPTETSASNLAKELDSKGQVDPVSGLGIRNPVCDQLAQIRDRETRLSCEANGSPESEYPTSNYGFDVFIATGVTHPIGDFTAAFVTVLNGIWLGLIFVLKLTMELLGLAFGLNPFAGGKTMSRVSFSVGRIYSEVTDPWLSTLVVCAGIWFAYRGLIRRDLAGSVAGTLAAVAMIVLGLWVVHQPRESVGRLSQVSDEVALGVISAPQSGSIDRPVGSYAEAMSATWSRLVEVPFAGLDFSDVGWALSRPPPEAVERADNWFCQDVGALATIAAYQRLGDSKASEDCAAFARKRYGKPRRVIDLYLRSSPGSPAREVLWHYFDGDDDYKPKVAAQGGDGALTRLSMLALFAIGLLGAILLLAWLAIRLFGQAAIAFVLLLAAPFALFFPLLGDAGRRAFRTWGLTLLGAVAAKVIYAAFLSIVLLGISILGSADGPGGSATGFLLSSAFTWSVFLKRADLIGWLSIGEVESGAGRGLGLGGFFALNGARRLSRGGAESLRGVAARGSQWGRERRSLGVEATRRSALGSLQGSARALADHRYREARNILATDPQAAAPHSEPRSIQSPSIVECAAPKPPRRAAEGNPAEIGTPAPGQLEAARDLLARVDHNKRRLGTRFSATDLERYAKEDRRLLESSRDPADHSHRVGIERSRFEGLRGPERERVEVEIERARKRDLKRLAATEATGGALGRPRLATERLRQSIEDGGTERREELRKLHRERRPAEHLAPRRNLSRGS